MRIDSSGHRLMMKIGTIAGFVTARPANRMLSKKGWKERMDPRGHAGQKPVHRAARAAA